MGDRSDRVRRSRRRTKDRVLQARIPEDLDEQLRDRAEHLGISVSTVVRNVLLHTFDLVEGVVTDSAELARVVQGRGTVTTRRDEPATDNTGHTDVSVIGWQPAILNRNGICEHCNAILEKGVQAAVGVPVQARPVLLCLSCLENLATEGNTTAELALQEPAGAASNTGKKVSEDQ